MGGRRWADVRIVVNVRVVVDTTIGPRPIFPCFHSCRTFVFSAVSERRSGRRRFVRSTEMALHFIFGRPRGIDAGSARNIVRSSLRRKADCSSVGDVREANLESRVREVFPWLCCFAARISNLEAPAFYYGF